MRLQWVALERPNHRATKRCLMRRFVRETAFRFARRDLLQFIKDHEEDLLRIFREEMERLDERMPEEQVFIDLRMVPLGEELLQAVLATLKRFLREC